MVAADVEVLDLFFKPKSVAIVGLSRSAIGAPISVLTTLKDFDYGGRIHIVNPNVESTKDFKAWARLEDINDAIDLVIVSVVREQVLAVLRSCIEKNIRAAIVITQGFADADETGTELQAEMVALARDGHLRILGPNTIGVANAHANFSSSFIETYHDTTPIGLVSQSGLFMMGHNLVMNEPGGFCMSVDLGNACDVGLVDVLDYYEQTDAVEVIACHLEAVDDGPAFVDVARRVSRSKPIVALKAGKSETARAAVASHTGAAAGENRIYEAAFRRAGVVPARNAEELRLLAKAFATYNPPRGRRVAVVSYSGGGAILAIDAVESAGLELAKLTKETSQALVGQFPDWMAVDNPLDVWIPVAKDYHTAFPSILERVLQDDNVDAVICIYCSYSLPKYADYDASLYIGKLSTAYPNKPILGWSYGMDIAGFTEQVERDGNAMVFPSLEDATGSLARMLEWDTYRRDHDASDAAKPAADRAAARAIIDSAVAEGKVHLFVEGLEILEAYGIDIAPWAFAADADQLAVCAAELPYPLCLKVVSSDIVHKSDSGGIRLGIETESDLLDSYTGLMGEVARHRPDAKVAGVVVQAMVSRGKEVMIGAKRDATFGPSVVLGAGGIYTEILDDFAVRLAPVSLAEAHDMIEELTIARILKGVRGEAPCDLARITETLTRVAALVCDHPEIQEIDVNPLLVDSEGAVAVDARIILGPLAS